VGEAAPQEREPRGQGGARGAHRGHGARVNRGGHVERGGWGGLGGARVVVVSRVWLDTVFLHTHRTKTHLTPPPLNSSAARCSSWPATTRPRA
jgi:hypothetical protein